MRQISPSQATAQIALLALHVPLARQLRRYVRQGPSPQRIASRRAPHAATANIRTRVAQRRANHVRVAATVHQEHPPSSHAWPGRTRAWSVSHTPTIARRAQSGMRVRRALQFHLHARQEPSRQTRASLSASSAVVVSIRSRVARVHVRCAHQATTASKARLPHCRAREGRTRIFHSQ